MRNAISNFLAHEAKTRNDFYVLTGDHGYALFDKLRIEAPEKFINVGVTEQAMVGCAAGLAKTGKKVFIYGLSAFLPLRVLEFIKLSICYEGLPVVILGDGAGTVYTTLGVSHQCTEDIACLKPLPIKIYSPADATEIALCLEDANKENRPCYIRIGKSDKPRVHEEGSPVKLGPALSAFKGTTTAAFFATGSMVSTAMEISKEMGHSTYSCPVLSFYDESLLVSELIKFKTIITLEEHSVHGGLGSIIGDVILNHQLPVRLIKYGITKSFTDGVGSYEYAIRYHKLDKASLMQDLKEKLL